MPYNQTQAVAALQIAQGDLSQTLAILDDLESGVTIPFVDLQDGLTSGSNTLILRNHAFAALALGAAEFTRSR